MLLVPALDLPERAVREEDKGNEAVGLRLGWDDLGTYSASLFVAVCKDGRATRFLAKRTEGTVSVNLHLYFWSVLYDRCSFEVRPPLIIGQRTGIEKGGFLKK